MIRKLLITAAAVAIPIGAFAAISTTTTAGASGSDHVGPYTCAITGLVPPAATITFAGVGLSVAGSVAETTTVKQATTAAVLPASPTCGAVNGSIGALKVITATDPCSATTTPALGPICTAGDFAYGSWAAFLAGGAANLVTGLPHPKFKVDGDTFAGTTTAASAIYPGGGCGTDAGFLLSGTVAANEGYSAFSIQTCLGNVTSPVGSAGRFITDVGVNTVKTVQFDPTDSTLSIS